MCIKETDIAKKLGMFHHFFDSDFFRRAGDVDTLNL